LAQLTVAISGIAGPGGATPDKPVGTVCFAWATDQQVVSETRQFSGDREAVRHQAVIHALKGLLARAVV
jgi:nicotinamide-nucleotide amidase